MTDQFGNRMPANEHPRKLPPIEYQSGGGGSVLIFVVSLIVMVGIAATAVMAFAKIAVWAWS